MNAEQRQVAANLLTKPTDLKLSRLYRQLRHYIHHRHLYTLNPKAETYFTVPRRVKG